MLTKIIDFLLKYSTYKRESYEELKKKIEGHIRCKTCRIFIDRSGEIYAVCFWNISDDMQFADVTDLVIREDWRKKDLMKTILIDGLKIWPVKYLRYDRDYTEDGSNRGPTRKISVEKFLRRLK